MVGHGGSSAGSYLADPTSPIPFHCASIVATSTSRVKGHETVLYIIAAQLTSETCTVYWSHKDTLQAFDQKQCGNNSKQTKTTTVFKHLMHARDKDLWYTNSWKKQGKKYIVATSSHAPGVSRGVMRSTVSSYMQQCVWLLVRAPCSSLCEIDI